MHHIQESLLSLWKHNENMVIIPHMVLLQTCFFFKFMFTFRGRHAGVFWIIVMLYNPSALQEVMVRSFSSGVFGREQNLWFH